MITDIPSAEDFKTSGLAFLNLAWDTAIALLVEFDRSGAEAFDEDGAVHEEYWIAAQKSLATAAALVGQGAEFLLKGRIAEVSPFLLLSGSPRNWPGGSHVKDVPFSRFRSVDAQDLVKIHDTVRRDRVPPDLRTRLDVLRERRNSIMHTIDRHLRVVPLELIVDILEIVHYLAKQVRWIDARWKHYEEGPNSVVYSTDYVRGIVFTEVMKAIELLEPHRVQTYFGFNKKQRLYWCSECRYGADSFTAKPSALLETNSSDGESVRCIICSAQQGVIRLECPGETCRGDVLGIVSQTCLTCGTEMEIEA